MPKFSLFYSPRSYLRYLHIWQINFQPNYTFYTRPDEFFHLHQNTLKCMCDLQDVSTSLLAKVSSLIDLTSLHGYDLTCMMQIHLPHDKRGSPLASIWPQMCSTSVDAIMKSLKKRFFVCFYWSIWKFVKEQVASANRVRTTDLLSSRIGSYFGIWIKSKFRTSCLFIQLHAVWNASSAMTFTSIWLYRFLRHTHELTKYLFFFFSFMGTH